MMHKNAEAIERLAKLRRLALALASATGFDPRTCRKALVDGPFALRATNDQERIIEAAEELGISLPLEAA